MGTGKGEIGEWFDRGVAQGAEFMVVVCDTFDHEDFPKYVKPGEDVHAVVKAASNETAMSRVMEVYSLKSSKEVQLAEHRAFHFEHFKSEGHKLSLQGAQLLIGKKVYEATRVLEELETQGLITGNGHHMRQQLAEAAKQLVAERWKKG